MLIFPVFADGRSFLEEQKKYPRVRQAIKEKDKYLKNLFLSKNLPYPPLRIYLRAFKLEKKLELWSYSPKLRRFKLVKVYKICRISGVLGPKRKEWDLQIPEGIYFIDRFNPVSREFLSLGLNYPNRSDRILGYKKHLGGNIFIHGGCGTRGCIPITDNKIKEVYWIAVQVRANGQRRIPVHIFPCRMTKMKMIFLYFLAINPVYFLSYKLRIWSAHPSNPFQLISFWNQLKPIYNFFEKKRTLPHIVVGRKGEYLIR